MAKLVNWLAKISWLHCRKETPRFSRSRWDGSFFNFGVENKENEVAEKTPVALKLKRCSAIAPGRKLARLLLLIFDGDVPRLRFL